MLKQTCQNAWCGKTFEVTDADLAFYDSVSPIFAGAKEAIPPPSVCPDCRTQQRTIHRNERFFYRTTSALSGKEMVALYAPEPVSEGPALKVYTQEEWKSDAFDPLVYGRTFDFSRPFFGQFGELMKDVPRVALITLSNENSEYSTGTAYCKNCYLINSSEYAEDCYYGKLYQKSRDAVDCCYVYDSQLCYDCFNVYNAYNCSHLFFSKNCSDCHFSSNLQGCKNCFLCTNLYQKEFHIENKPVSPEEYRSRVDAVLGSWEKTQETLRQLKELRRASVQKFANIVNSEDCTGDYIENSQHCLNCYDMTDSQDAVNVTVGVQVKDSRDCSNIYLKPELCYSTLGTLEGHMIAFCLYAFYCQRMLYCDTCYYCSDCFACSGLTRKQYCILNKQYSKEEYESLVPQIIAHMRETGEWGRFFPVSLSPFGYNESLAGEYDPLTKEEALSRGFSWREENSKNRKAQTYLLPDHIKDVRDDVIGELLVCEECGKNYKIIPQELSYYRTNAICLPHHCPDCRYMNRMTLRNPRRLWQRNCMKCSKEIETTYAPERPETVYCETCYLETVY